MFLNLEELLNLLVLVLTFFTRNFQQVLQVTLFSNVLFLTKSVKAPQLHKGPQYKIVPDIIKLTISRP